VLVAASDISFKHFFSRRARAPSFNRRAHNEHTPSSASPSAAGDKVEHKLSFSHKKSSNNVSPRLKKSFISIILDGDWGVKGNGVS
jgi:hypothetical protein